MLDRFLTFTSGCEAIDYQVNSKFLKDLIDIFEMGFTYRKTIDIGIVANRGEIAIRNFRAMEMCNYVKKFMMPEFTKVVKMYTGLNVSKVYTHTDINSGPAGFFAIDISFGDWIAANITMNRVTGINNNDTPKYGKVAEAIKDFQDMSMHFDKSKGKLTSDKFGKDRKFSVKIYFDALYAYCLHDFMNVHSVEEFTAGELAAIMLHEVGHALTFIERAGDLYFYKERLTKTLVYAKNHTDTKTLIEDNLPTVKGTLQRLIKNKNVDRKHIAFLIKTLDKIEHINNSIDEIPSDTSVTIINGILLLLKGIFMLIITLVLTIEGMTLTARLAIEATSSVSLNSDNKTSDTYSSAHNLRFSERMADEYASRHGAGGYLASGLAKLFKANLMMGATDSKTLRESVMVSLYMKMISQVLNFAYYMVPNYTYEENYTRIARVVQNAIVPLKDPKIPPGVRKDLIEDYEQALKICKDFKGVVDTDIIQQLMHVMKCFIDIPTIVRNFTNGGLRRDYEKLNDQLDEILNNKLYYQYNKFMSLTE